jgi:hypothetical protein
MRDCGGKSICVIKRVRLRNVVQLRNADAAPASHQEELSG